MSQDAPVALPAALAALVAGSEWILEKGGLSCAQVWRLRAKGRPDRFLKLVKRREARELRREFDAIEFLRGTALAPTNPFLFREPGRSFLLTDALPGHDAASASAPNAPELMRLLAGCLRRVHSIPRTKSPFLEPLSKQLGEAAERARTGRVDEEDFEPRNLGRDAGDLLFELRERAKGIQEDPVFCHGDFCLPNILLHRGRVSGVVDWGRAGVADRHQDIALLLRSFRWNTGKDVEDVFLDEYGLIQKVSREKCAFFELLDEFF